jgi:AcrR family transcriptional regulator
VVDERRRLQAMAERLGDAQGPTAWPGAAAAQLARLLALCRAESLVSVLGPGGSVKTRLAVAVARCATVGDGAIERAAFVPLVGAFNRSELLDRLQLALRLEVRWTGMRSACLGGMFGDSVYACSLAGGQCQPWSMGHRSAVPRSCDSLCAARFTTPSMPAKKTTANAPPLELREACIVAARQVIAERGVENLSLREVARKLGVSHQAPYKHYPSRDHLLAEVMRRCFQGFAEHLDRRARSDDPMQDLAALGEQYLAYARGHPLEYHLMFSTTWPESADEVGLVKDATHAFDVLRGVLRQLHGDAPSSREAIDLDALYIWSTMHGLAGVMNGPCIDKLDLKAKVLKNALQHARDRMSVGLRATV